MRARCFIALLRLRPGGSRGFTNVLQDQINPAGAYEAAMQARKR